MDQSKSPLTVIISPDADNDLWDIWRSNVEIYKDLNHADSYIEFLRTRINSLATSYSDGNTVEGFPEFRYVILRKSRKGHGHYVIYKVDEDLQLVKVLHIYHTRMDVQGRLKQRY